MAVGLSQIACKYKIHTRWIYTTVIIIDIASFACQDYRWHCPTSDMESITQKIQRKSDDNFREWVRLRNDLWRIPRFKNTVWSFKFASLSFVYNIDRNAATTVFRLIGVRPEIRYIKHLKLKIICNLPKSISLKIQNGAAHLFVCRIMNRPTDARDACLSSALPTLGKSHHNLVKLIPKYRPIIQK